MSQDMNNKMQQQTSNNPHCSRDTLSAGTHHVRVLPPAVPTSSIPRIKRVDEEEFVHGKGALVGEVPPLVVGQSRAPTIFFAQMCSLGVLFSQILHFGCQREK